MCAEDIGCSELAFVACFLFEALPSDMHFAMLCILLNLIKCVHPLHAHNVKC